MPVDCSKCDSPVETDQKKVSCSTCQLIFHTHCANVSDLKYDVLNERNSNIFWFCHACKITTKSMFNQLAQVLIELAEIKSERDQQKNEIATLSNLVRVFNDRIKKIEDETEMYASNLESTHTMVRDMLAELPQVTSIEEGFASLEDRIDQISQQNSEDAKRPSDIEKRVSLMEKNYEELKSQCEVNNSVCTSTCMSAQTLTSQIIPTSCPDNVTVAEIVNELEERNKRNSSLVIHNLPESTDENDDVVHVSNLLHEVLDNPNEVLFPTDIEISRPKIHRFGQRKSHRVRSLRVHLKSAVLCDKILSISRRLMKSENYSNIVLQKDMTPMERIHLKRLVYEKKRRNHEAMQNQEEPNWTIQCGILCRRYRN